MRFSPLICWGLGIAAALGILAFLAIFISPSILISLVPWKLTELTSRIFAGWSILTLATILSIASDGRWSATRMWADFDQTKPMTYVFVAGLLLSLAALSLIHIWMERASHKTG